MAKVNYTKVEEAMANAILKRMIDHLGELAAIAILSEGNASKKIPESKASEILKNFQNELKNLKEKDVKLYGRLELTPEEEARISLSVAELTPDDWKKLLSLRERIVDLKKELLGQPVENPEDEVHIEQQRTKHINKRYNVNDEWLPLH